MVAEDEPSTPLAWFRHSQRETVNGQEVIRPSMLFIHSDVDDVRDYVLVACLILEQKIRLRARSGGVALCSEPLWLGPRVGMPQQACELPCITLRAEFLY